MTIDQSYGELANSSSWWASARDRVKAVVEGPDADIDRIIKGVLDGSGKVPAELVASFPVLANSQVKAEVRNAVLCKTVLPRCSRGFNGECR